MFKSTMIDETTKSVVDLRGSKQNEGMTRYRYRAVLLLFLLLNLTACQTWQSVSLDAISPAQVIEEDQKGCCFLIKPEPTNEPVQCHPATPSYPARFHSS